MSTVRKSPLASAPKANAATLPDMLREPLLPVPNRPRSFEEIFDALMVAARGGKAHRVIEDHLRPVFEATHAVLWVSLDSERALYSPTHQLHAPLKANLVATGFRSCAAFHVPAMKAHPLFSVDVDARLIPPQQPLLMIPIYTKDNQGLGVLQFSRKEYKVFVSHEFTMANFLINKFKVFGRLLFFNQTAITAAIGASQFGSSNAIIESLRRTILRTFRCRRAELWIYDSARNRTLRYDGSEQDPFFCDLGKAGLAGYAIKHSMLINERSAQDHFAKNDRFDGLNDEPVLIYPYNETDELKWAISARGKIAPPFFSIGDEALMKAIAPFLVRSISESQTSGATAAIIQTYQNSLYALLDTAELLAGILDFDDLVCTIGAKTCELLNAHHFTLYLVSLDGDRLVSHPTDPNEAPVSVLVSSPIIGESACQGAIVNIADAQCDHRFDKSEDARRGRRTTALLSAPIRNGKGAVTGVALLTNRCDGGAFDVDAVKLLLSLTVLYGIALENARLSQAAAGLARRVPAFASQCASLGAKAAVRSALESALANAREIAGAAKVALWLCHGGDEIVQLLAVGHSAAATLPSVKAAVRARTFVVTDSQNRPAPSLQDGRVGRPADTRQEDLIGMNELDSMAYLRASRVMRVAAQKRDDVGAEEDSVCCVPLVNADGLVTGVLDVAGPRRIAQEEIRLLGAVAAFAAVVVEKGAHEALRNFTDQESDLQEYISMPERPRTVQSPLCLRSRWASKVRFSPLILTLRYGTGSAISRFYSLSSMPSGCKRPVTLTMKSCTDASQPCVRLITKCGATIGNTRSMPRNSWHSKSKRPQWIISLQRLSSVQ
jgi:GAF domain-containing protein